METHKLIVRTKENGSNKSLLNKGLIPGIVYGKGTKSAMIACNDQVLNKLMESKGFYTKIISIEIDGKTEKVLPKSLQYHPITDKVIHFDLLRVQDNTKVTVEVPVDFLNQDICPGLKKGGVLNVVRRTIELVCFAKDIPELLQCDVSEIDIGYSIKISNIQLPAGVQLTITDRDFVVATIVAPTIEVEETKPEEEGEGVEGEGVEGEGVEGEGAESSEGEKTEGKKEEGPAATKEAKQEKKEDKK